MREPCYSRNGRPPPVQTQRVAEHANFGPAASDRFEQRQLISRRHAVWCHRQQLRLSAADLPLNCLTRQFPTRSVMSDAYLVGRVIDHLRRCPRQLYRLTNQILIRLARGDSSQITIPLPEIVGGTGVTPEAACFVRVPAAATLSPFQNSSNADDRVFTIGPTEKTSSPANWEVGSS